MSVLSIILLAGLGLIAGSFDNALVWRLHRQLATGKTKAVKPKDQQLSIVSGRSICPNCRHVLAWYDLIPVFSWLWLRGKCRYCQAPISIQYPLVELATAGLFVASYAVLSKPLSGIELFELICWLIVLTGLVALFIYDLRWMWLPNRIVYPLLVIALFQLVVSTIAHHSINPLWQGIQGGVVIGGILYGLFAISKGKWIGGGDVKLAGLLGLTAAGPLAATAILFGASLLGSIVSAPLLASKKVKVNSRVPFGPFLIIAGILMKLVGAGLLNWYRNKVLLLS